MQIIGILNDDLKMVLKYEKQLSANNSVIHSDRRIFLPGMQENALPLFVGFLRNWEHLALGI